MLIWIALCRNAPQGDKAKVGEKQMRAQGGTGEGKKQTVGPKRGSQVRMSSHCQAYALGPENDFLRTSFESFEALSGFTGACAAA